MNQAAPKADAPMSFPIPNFVPALNALQKELFDTFDGMNREWVSRVQSEAKLASDFVEADRRLIDSRCCFGLPGMRHPAVRNVHRGQPPDVGQQPEAHGDRNAVIHCAAGRRHVTASKFPFAIAYESWASLLAQRGNALVATRSR